MARRAGLVALVATTVAAQDHEFLPFVATGRHFSLFVNPFFNQVFATGRNNYGQLGTDTGDTEIPLPVIFPFSENNTNSTNDTNETSQPKVIAAAVGYAHSIFLTDDGQAWVTGWNRYGQLADPEERNQVSLPIKIIDSGVRAVAAGYAHSLFLTDTGLRGAGWNAAGQLGLGDTAARTALTDIDFPDCAAPCEIESIAAGYDTSFAVTTTGEVWAFGNNLGGQLGLQTWNIQMTPALVPMDAMVTAVAAGTAHTLFRQADAIKATGANFAGQLGDGNMGAQPSEPVSVVFDLDVVDVFAGGDSSCIMGGTDAAIYGFGSNLDGQLGLGNLSDSPTPLRIDLPEDAEDTRFQMVALGNSHSQFLGELGRAFASGANSFGELGDETTESRSTLLQVLDLFVLTTKGPTVSSTTSTTTTTMSSTTTTVTMSDDAPPETTRDTSDGVIPGLDQTTLNWLIGVGVTTFGLCIGCAAQGQAAKAAAQDDEDPEVELTGNS